MIRVGILGAGGFTGQELIRIFARHPHTELVYITSSEYANKPLEAAFPNLANPVFGDLKFSVHPQVIADVPKLDAIFLATPDDASLKWAPEFLKAGIKVVDISGAFRLKNPAEFKEYYGLEQTSMATLEKAVYGLTEIHRDEIKKADIVSNPGCYPTAAALPLWVYRDLIDFSKPVIVDAKSGTSGAGGRKEKDGLGYSTVYENFRSYKTAAHQHMPEIAQELSLVTKKTVHVRFTPHLLPMYRGILSSAYAFPLPGKTAADFKKAAENVRNETFLRHRENVDAVEVKHVQHTNFCDYAHFMDEKNGLVQIVSAIDNLVKGAAGQAVQNLNLMFGFSEAAGVI